MPKIKVTIKRLIEMKLCMSHYSHKSMPDAKVESGSCSVLEYIDVTKFASEERNKPSSIYSWKMDLTL